MSEPAYTINFSGVDEATAGNYADELRDAIREEDPELQVDRRRGRDDRQDFGATLAVILGTEAVIILAQGISKWIASHQEVTLEVTRPDGQVVKVTHLNGPDANTLAETILKPR
jgi:hypothetical protein